MIEVNRCKQEEKIEGEDPVSFEDALARVVNDVDSLFVDLDGEDIQAYFFRPLRNTESDHRLSLDEFKAQWIRRWVESHDHARDEASKLVRFAGEYLVVNSTYVG
jgi:hypothetical protein